MNRKEKDGVHWLEFELLKNCTRVKNGVFLRRGGLSLPPFKGFNLGDRVGDSVNSVKMHVKKVASLLHIPTLSWVKQMHGKNVLFLNGREDANVTYEADAMITAVPHLGLLVHHADCQAAIIYDPIHHVVANVHCGWRGNVQNIYGVVIKQMQLIYGCNPKNLLVCISPSLGPEESEFLNYKKEFPEHLWGYQIKPNYFDLWKMSTDQICDAGVELHHIEVANLSTYANPEDFFSYRRDRVTGRNGTVVVLN